MDCLLSITTVAMQILFSLGACGKSSCCCFLILAKSEQVVGCVCFAVCLACVPTFCLVFSILSCNRFLNIYTWILDVISYEWLYFLLIFFNYSRDLDNFCWLFVDFCVFGITQILNLQTHGGSSLCDRELKDLVKIPPQDSFRHFSCH